VEKAVHAGGPVDHTAERGNIVLRVFEGGQGSGDVMVNVFGFNVRFDNGFAARAKTGEVDRGRAHKTLQGNARQQCAGGIAGQVHSRRTVGPAYVETDGLRTVSPRRRGTSDAG
jgi:hypothetical protein